MFDTIKGMFGMGPNPADAAMPYLNQIPGQLHQTFDPYINRGNEQYAGLNTAYGAMGQDPVAFLEQLMGKYQPSQAYKLRRDEASQAAANSAAASGMRGSLQDITNQSRLTDALLGEDMQQWLNNVMGIQARGLGGQQHIYDTGYNAAQNLGGDLSNVLGTQGQLAFQGQAQKNKSLQDLFQGLLGAGAMGAGAYFGAGAGGGVGNQIMNAGGSGWATGAPRSMFG